ncbi:uncharacterized protein CDAR_276551 [Caerostris darwini]|uniref:Reverse transcriptase domain-containing protein n=1 Tax=Caerostris darwini TaxID=1538125 RepID=A0AAV4N1T8_9ARAC|nr:uncharacterized protein CDAR_276551 [Caerostris darwini]
MDLTIENSPSSIPTFDCSRGQSWIDLLLTKNIDKGISMEVTEILNSGHNLLHFLWTLDDLLPPEKTINISQNNWLTVKSSIFNIIKAHSSSGFSDLKSLISTIQTEITARLSTTSKNKRLPQRARGAVWWTQELQTKRSKTRALKRLYQKENEPTLRTTKLAAFKRNIKRSSILKEDGSTTSTLQDTYSEILSFHFPCSAFVESILPSTSSPQDFVPITPLELEAVIEGIKSKKASGIDGLPGEIVKEIFYANPVWFISLFNFLFSSEHFPHIWKWARIVLIPKKGRALNNPQDFRPICILPCWGEVLDKIIIERLAYHLESGKLLHDFQYVFRKQKSTINALQHIKDFVLSARNRKHLTCLVSIDMANAFNSVDWTRLKKKISLLAIPEYLKIIIFNFLKTELSPWEIFHKDTTKVSLKVLVWVPCCGIFLSMTYFTSTLVRIFVLKALQTISSSRLMRRPHISLLRCAQALFQILITGFKITGSP